VDGGAIAIQREMRRRGDTRPLTLTASANTTDLAAVSGGAVKFATTIGGKNTIRIAAKNLDTANFGGSVGAKFVVVYGCVSFGG